YFGRARDLPGVKELFEAAARPAQHEETPTTRAQLNRNVDAGYYGYNLDEEDGTLLEYEIQKEAEAYEALMGQPDVLDGKEAKGEWEELPGDQGDGVRWSLPGAEEVQEELLERRRRRLLDKLG
ncbi:hypothetical protein M501DRAFT_1021081, partial [Patellaria atrata CBS 101060]